MCIESSVVLVCFGSSAWVLASESWQCWYGFSRWHARTLLDLKFADDIYFFAKTFEEPIFC